MRVGFAGYARCGRTSRVLHAASKLARAWQQQIAASRAHQPSRRIQAALVLYRYPRNRRCTHAIAEDPPAALPPAPLCSRDVSSTRSPDTLHNLHRKGNAKKFKARQTPLPRHRETTGPLPHAGDRLRRLRGRRQGRVPPPREGEPPRFTSRRRVGGRALPALSGRALDINGR